MELSPDTLFSTFWKILTELQTKKQATFGEKYLWRQNHNDKPARVRRIFSRPGSGEKNPETVLLFTRLPFTD